MDALTIIPLNIHPTTGLGVLATTCLGALTIICMNIYTIISFGILTTICLCTDNHLLQGTDNFWSE